MDWAPNEQGLKWFVQEVVPYVIKENPEFVFRMAGKKIPIGFICIRTEICLLIVKLPDALKYHEDKAIMIVPLLSEAAYGPK